MLLNSVKVVGYTATPCVLSMATRCLFFFVMLTSSARLRNVLLVVIRVLVVFHLFMCFSTILPKVRPPQRKSTKRSYLQLIVKLRLQINVMETCTQLLWMTPDQPPSKKNCSEFLRFHGTIAMSNSAVNDLLHES